jgi:hypothetical protein
MKTSAASRVLAKSPEHEISGTQADVVGKKSRIIWTEDDYRKLKDAHSQGLTAKAASTLFPTKSFHSVRNKYRLLNLRDEQPSLKTAFAQVPWSAVEKHLLQELIAAGASRREMVAHFPTRSQSSVNTAASRYKLSLCTKSPGASSKCSAEDYQYFTKLALQGTSKQKIAEAMGRTGDAINSKAWQLGVRIQSTKLPYTPETKERVLQMRIDGASFNDIGAALGRSPGTLRHMYYMMRPDTEHDAKMQRQMTAGLSLSDVQAVKSMRDKGASWPDIGRQFPEHDLLQLRNDLKLFMKPGLSSRELREIEQLRAEGKSWRELAISGNYPCKSQSGLHRAYHRGLEQQK